MRLRRKQMSRISRSPPSPSSWSSPLGTTRKGSWAQRLGYHPLLLYHTPERSSSWLSAPFDRLKRSDLASPPLQIRARCRRRFQLLLPSTVQAVNLETNVKCYPSRLAYLASLVCSASTRGFPVLQLTCRNTRICSRILSPPVDPPTIYSMPPLSRWKLRRGDG
jgi:hypothetical protein